MHQRTWQVVAQLASWGVFRTADAIAAGVSDDSLRRAAQVGRLQRLRKGIYRIADHPWLWESQLWAALFDAGPGAVVSHRSAARLHGMYHYVTTTAIEVTRVASMSHRVTLGRLHQTLSLPSEHITEIHGFPVTTLARTCFDLAGDPDEDIRGKPWCEEAHHRRVRRAWNDALARRGLTFFVQVSVFVALAKRGRKGTALARKILAGWGPDYVPSESDAEDLFQELVEAYALPEGAKQVAFYDDEGFIGRVDRYYAEAKLIVEIDSRWHDGPDDKADDKVRDARLTALGYDVKRIYYGEMVLQPSATMEGLRQLLATSGGNTPESAGFRPKFGEEVGEG
jgi:hypothetical protein